MLTDDQVAQIEAIATAFVTSAVKVRDAPLFAEWLDVTRQIGDAFARFHEQAHLVGALEADITRLERVLERLRAVHKHASTAFDATVVACRRPGVAGE